MKEVIKANIVSESTSYDDNFEPVRKIILECWIKYDACPASRATDQEHRERFVTSVLGYIVPELE